MGPERDCNHGYFCSTSAITSYPKRIAGIYPGMFAPVAKRNIYDLTLSNYILKSHPIPESFLALSCQAHFSFPHFGCSGFRKARNILPIRNTSFLVSKNTQILRTQDRTSHIRCSTPHSCYLIHVKPPSPLRLKYQFLLVFMHVKVQHNIVDSIPYLDAHTRELW